MSARRRTRGETGAVALEFALIVPLFIALLMGVVTTAMAYFDDTSATNAVREAARYGSTADITQSTWASSVRTWLRSTYFNSSATVTDAQVCVDLVKSDGTVVTSVMGSDCGTAPTVPTMASGTCVVRVWMRRPESITPIVSSALNFSISARSVALYARAGGTTCPAS